MSNVRSIEQETESVRYYRTLGEQEGTRAARARARAILTAPEAAGRFELALHLTLDSEMTVEQALGALRASPKAAQDATRPGEAFYAEHARRGATVGADRPGLSSRFVAESREKFSK